MFVCLYVDDLIFISSNIKMFDKCKKKMAQEFEMTDLGLMTYYLGSEVKQGEESIFISQKAYAEKVLKEFQMEHCNPVNTLMECGSKLMRFDDGEKVNSNLFRRIVGSLRFLTCTRPDILYRVGIISRFMEAPRSTHIKSAKRILRYIKDTMDYDLFCATKAMIIQIVSK